jgi:hypothetical protein
MKRFLAIVLADAITVILCIMAAVLLANWIGPEPERWGPWKSVRQP